MVLVKKSENYPNLIIKHQKLFRLSCFELVSDVYLISLKNCKYCNTAHVYDLEKKKGNFQGFEEVVVQFIAATRRFNIRRLLKLIVN